MLGRAWLFALFVYSAPLYGLGQHSGPFPLSLRTGELSPCVNQLLQTVIRRRFSGETAWVNFGSPGVLRFGRGLDELLRAAQVPENYVHRIGALMAQLLMSDWDGDAMLREPMGVLQDESTRRGLTLCLLSGNCTGRHDGLYVSPQRDFELASLRNPEFSEAEDRDYRIQLSARAPSYPPLIIASTQALQPSDDRAEEQARAIRWVGMLFHELKHHTNRTLAAQWIQANLWFRTQGRSTDRLFQRYVDIRGPVPRVDRGFLTIFEESTAHNAAFRVIAQSLEQGGAERTRAALIQANHARNKVDEIRKGTYGPSAAKCITEGLDLADHLGPISEANFLLVGATIQQQMTSTVERFEREMGAVLPVPQRMAVPSYNVTPLNTSPPRSDTAP